jgi:hypothetical protein
VWIDRKGFGDYNYRISNHPQRMAMAEADSTMDCMGFNLIFLALASCLNMLNNNLM